LFQKKFHSDMLKIGSVANNNAVVTWHRAVDLNRRILMTKKKTVNKPHRLILFLFLHRLLLF